MRLILVAAVLSLAAASLAAAQTAGNQTGQSGLQQSGQQSTQQQSTGQQTTNQSTGQAQTGSSVNQSATTKQPGSNDEQELMRLEREWVQAGIKRDASVLDRIEADDYTFTAPEGMVFTKAQDMATITSGDLTVESADIDDMKVRLYGDTAVVTGRLTMKGRYKGKDISGQYRGTDVFVKQGGRWRAVASHSTRIAGQQAQGQPNQTTPQQQSTEKKP